MQNAICYLKATNIEEMQQGIDTLLNTDSQRPVLLEVFTRPADDQSALQAYYQSVTQ